MRPNIGSFSLTPNIEKSSSLPLLVSDSFPLTSFGAEAAAASKCPHPKYSKSYHYNKRYTPAKEMLPRPKLSSMLKPYWVSIRPGKLLLSQWLCPACQSRLQWPYRQASSLSQPAKPSSEPKPPSDEDFTPKPLSRPLGQSKPPRPGENSGVDHRNWRQRRDDFFNYDKHLERRKELYVPCSPSPPLST